MGRLVAEISRAGFRVCVLSAVVPFAQSLGFRVWGLGSMQVSPGLGCPGFWSLRPSPLKAMEDFTLGTSDWQTFRSRASLGLVWR